MVDDSEIHNHIEQSAGKPGPAWEVPLLLLGAFRSIIDDAHALLAERGHPGTRAVHGFTLQAIGDGATGSEIAARLGVSQQAASKTVAMLEQQGYVERTVDPSDTRRRVVRRSQRGEDLLLASAKAFGEIVDEWSGRIGRDRVDQLHAALKGLAGPTALDVDLASWSGD